MATATAREPYSRLWRVVDGAVRDAFRMHPDYLTRKGNRNARNSVTKRVTGTVLGFALEEARGRLQTAEKAGGLIVRPFACARADILRAGRPAGRRHVLLAPLVLDLHERGLSPAAIAAVLSRMLRRPVLRAYCDATLRRRGVTPHTIKRGR